MVTKSRNAEVEGFVKPRSPCIKDHLCLTHHVKNTIITSLTQRDLHWQIYLRSNTCSQPWAAPLGYKAEINQAFHETVLNLCRPYRQHTWAADPVDPVRAAPLVYKRSFTHTCTHSHTSPLNTHKLVRRRTLVNKEASNDVYLFTVQWVHMVFRVNGLTKCSFAFACKYLYVCEKRLSTASTAGFSSVVIKGSWQRGVGGRGMSNVGTNTLL